MEATPRHSGFSPIRLFVLVVSLLALQAGTAQTANANREATRPLAASGGPNVDDDNDGWTELEGDCCDEPGTCPNPALVNPGAFEYPGNLIDDDCDGAVDEAAGGCDNALPSNSSDPLQYAQAMELCQSTTENPPITQRRWGVINAQLLLADGTGSPNTNSRSIRPNFGTANYPRSGERFSVFSSGYAASVGQVSPAYADFQPGEEMLTQSDFPADWFAANGSNLPNAPGCPEPSGLVAYDPVMLQLRVRVPTNARSFRFATRFFSAEYPEWVCSPYNDFYVVLLDSRFAGAPSNPTDKNLARYTGATGVYPLGVNLTHGNTGLFQACVNGSTGCADAGGGTTSSCTGPADLAGTGFDIADPGNCDDNSVVGGGTAWLATHGNVVPGETIVLRFAIWDTSDGSWDSVALLDNFQWSDKPTIPGTYHINNQPGPALPRAKGDFNSDGKADLVWRNYSTGDVNVWFLNGTNYQGGANLFKVLDPNWRLEGSGDFDGNGSPDLLWRNYSTGDVNVWFLNGTSYIGGANLFRVTDAAWKIEGIADFNSDGKLDIVWRNYVSGAVNVWYMDGTTYLGGVNLFTVADANWHLEGTGDFDGDGDPDLIWRHYSTGDVNVWFLTQGAYVGGANLFRVSDLNWKIQAIEDYSGDGKPDLVWRNYATGDVNIWFMDGVLYDGGTNLFNVPPPNWEISAPR